MFTNNDILNYFFIVKNVIFLNSTDTTTILNSIILDSNYIFFNNFTSNIALYYTNYLYDAILYSNCYFLSQSFSTGSNISFSFFILSFVTIFFKLSLFIYIILTIFILLNFENYIKQINSINMIGKLFILNATEKEVGPADDYYFFSILFFLTVLIFVFSAIFLLILQTNIFLWALGGFFLLTLLILTIPVNLFIDFGIVFCTVIRGSASSNNIIKELVFDIISTTTVFIRFVIQNIRFFFIFSGIFELLEWTISNNSSLFVSEIYTNSNLFVVDSFFASKFTLSSFNFLLLNSLLSIILYFYYILHLLFLLLVQITIYLGISIWLFFFLYSTKFLNRFEKYFSFIKLNN